MAKKSKKKKSKKRVEDQASSSTPVSRMMPGVHHEQASDLEEKEDSEAEAEESEAGVSVSTQQSAEKRDPAELNHLFPAKRSGKTVIQAPKNAPEETDPLVSAEEHGLVSPAVSMDKPEEKAVSAEVDVSKTVEAASFSESSPLVETPEASQAVLFGQQEPIKTDETPQSLDIAEKNISTEQVELEASPSKPDVEPSVEESAEQVGSEASPHKPDNTALGAGEWTEQDAEKQELRPVPAQETAPDVDEPAKQVVLAGTTEPEGQPRVGQGKPEATEPMVSVTPSLSTPGIEIPHVSSEQEVAYQKTERKEYPAWSHELPSVSEPEELGGGIANRSAQENAPKQDSVVLEGAAEESEENLPYLEGEHLPQEQLFAVIQNPQKGIYLFHRRARRRLFLDKVGLNHKHPLPEAPVVTLERTEFERLVSLENPELLQGLDTQNLPNQVILLDLLSARTLNKTSKEHVLWRYWSWLVQGELMRQWDTLHISVHELHNLIGHTAFEEVRSFLSRERYLFDPQDDKEVAKNLIGHWGMMRYFSPHYRADLFPSIRTELFDAWLDGKGWRGQDIVSRWRPAVANTIPQHLPIPCPPPWLSWGLSMQDLVGVTQHPASEQHPNKTTEESKEGTQKSLQTSAGHNDVEMLEQGREYPEGKQKEVLEGDTWLIQPLDDSPTRGRLRQRERYVRQPGWSAVVGLGMLLGGLGIFAYFMQRLALFQVVGVFDEVEFYGGPHFQAVPSVNPYALMGFIWGGWLLLLLAHCFDIVLQWRMFFRWRRDHYWVKLLEPGDLQDAQKQCLRDTDILKQENPEVPLATSDVWWKEWGQSLWSALVHGIYRRLWGTILELYPMQGLPVPHLDRWIAYRKLSFYVYSFQRCLQKTRDDSHRGNVLSALQAISEARSFYKPLAGGDTRILRGLQREQQKLQRQVAILFGESIPKPASPTGRAVANTLIVLVFWSLLISTYGLFWSLAWGFVLYLLISQLLDVWVIQRGMLHFWRRPVWVQYLHSEERQEAQRLCQGKAALLWEGSQAASKPEQVRPLYQEILLAVVGGIGWWIKVRLWGGILTGILFHWGRFPIVLRFTAREILRKQVFEFFHHLEWGVYAKQRGNDAEAAIQLTEAIAYYQSLIQGTDALLRQLYEEREKRIDAIMEQLVAAHQACEHERTELREMIAELLDVPISTSLGQQCAALLKTLQRSYLDKERRFSMTRPLRWLLSLGRESIEQPLEHYGLVRCMHYLQSSLKKLAHLPLPDEKRQRWEHPLYEARHALEEKIRQQFRPAMLAAMQEAGFVPTRQRDQVAQLKICEELLDRVVSSGRFSFSDVRDVISRNDLRLQDPSWRELLTRDVLLRLDQQFEERFNEIYRESEVYLRVLQRISNMSFGTGLGRFLVKYFLLPFGGSATVLVFLASMIEAVYKYALKKPEYHSPLKETFPIVVLGIVIALVIHTETGRDIFRRILQGIMDMLRGLFIHAPHWVIERPAIQFLLRHPKAALFYRFVLVPLLVAIVLFGVLLGILGLLTFPVTWQELTLLFVLSTALSYMFFTTATGRAIWDQMAFHLLAFWQQVKDRWVIGLFHWTLDLFRMLLNTLDYIVYRGDDLLRFHPGESKHMVSIKAVGQAVWSSITYTVRLIANLFVEPQVNPIKHFPVVTVSHKMISAATAGLIPWMVAQHYSTVMITLASAAFQLALPGLCGFLVWEFKENWKLFRANHETTPQPALVGSHGETMDAMLRRGFHSGTLPKLYEKLNAYIQQEYLAHDRSQRRNVREKLHHIEESLMAFVERELLATLRQHSALHHKYPQMGQELPRISSNHIDLFFWIQAEEPKQRYLWRLRIELEGGWLVGAVHELEAPTHPKCQWLRSERELIDEALEVFFQKSGVRLVRKKLEEWLSFYLRGYKVGVPGAVKEPLSAEYTIHKDEVRVRKFRDDRLDGSVVYRLDEKGRLYEPAPIVTLQPKDEFLPSSAHGAQLSGQYRSFDVIRE